MAKVKEYVFKAPWMYPEQAEIFNSPAKYKFVPKGRRAGFTEGCAIHLTTNCLAGKIKRGLWVDVKNANIDKYFDRYFRPILSQIPRELWIYRQVKKELVFKLGNEDAIVDFGSAEYPEGIEGFGYQTIILNEAGLILKDENLWYSTLMPMTVDYEDTEILCGGTPRGKNLFFRLVQEAQEKANREVFRITPYDNPYLSKEQLQELEDSIPQRFRDQELYGKFIDDGGSVFRGINECIKGELEPPNPHKSYKVGIDLARKSDYTAICILDNNDHLCAVHRMKNIDWTVQKMRIADLVKKYGATGFCDSTGIGDPVLSDLQDMGLNLKGFQFTAKTKTQLIDNLSIAIEQQEISFPNIPELINELESYEFDQGPSNVKYGTQSEHDDIVTALALAYWQTTIPPFKYTLHYADRMGGRPKSIFEMEREYERTGKWTRRY